MENEKVSPEMEKDKEVEEESSTRIDPSAKYQRTEVTEFRSCLLYTSDAADE